ncbi:MAG: insulinase family protein [Planctomycetes bacterium]|nr:insulinase family protein [Planctomycetota bacterium]
MAQDVHIHTFPNGLTLLAERMPHVRSAALNFLVPAGYAHDPPAQLGLTSVLSELITRGAGKRSSRELSLALDNLGLDRDTSAGSLHMRFWGATLADNLPAALEIYADILRRPALPAEEIDAVRALALQDLQSLDDEPRHKVIVELRQRHFPPPLNRDRRGTFQGLETLTIDKVRRHYQSVFRPHGTILSVAGQIDWKKLRDQVEKLFGDWDGPPATPIKLGKPSGGRVHLTKETTQTQIALAYPSVPIGHPDYFSAQGAVQVLSGGMSARLFTEVREKRGLCYAVWASYQTYKELACILCYAGTTNERAQETLNVTLAEVCRLEDGIFAEEVERVQAGLKSSLIMQEESTSARAGALASDWYYLGRVRSLQEIQDAVDALTPRKIVNHLRRFPPGDFTMVTLGPKPLRFPRRGVARRKAAV